MDLHTPSPGPSRALQKEQILQVYKKGGLGFRSITSSTETLFLNQSLREPRPVYMVAEDLPVQMRSNSETTIGITDPKPLYLFKKNAVTSTLASNKRDPEELHTKCLPDLPTLLEKMHEQAERIYWGVYPGSTSGHLKEDGTYKLPKPKQQVYDHLRHSELVMEGYDKRQIVCYVVSQDDTRSMNEILTDKHSLEKGLALEPLPIVYYQSSRGSVKVYFEDELVSASSDLAANEFLLNEFCNSLAISPYRLKNTLSLLPLPEKTESMTALASSYSAPFEGTPTGRDLVDLVTVPNDDSINILREYISKGARINGLFAHSGEYHSLPYILLYEEWFRNDNPDNKRITQILTLFSELIRYGVEINSRELDELLRMEDPFIKGFTNLLVAAGYTLPDRYDYFLFCDYCACAGTTVAFNNLFQTMLTSSVQKHLETLLTDHCRMNWRLPKNFHQHLMMLFHFGADPRPLRDSIISAIKEWLESESYGYFFSCKSENNNPEECADYLISLWEGRNTDPLFVGWQQRVAEATVEIEALRRELKPYPERPATNRWISIEEQIKPLTTAFQKPLQLTRAGDDEETILRILEHYYRRPGLKRLQWSLQNDHPKVWKPLHSCSHVLRTRNNVLWYMDLLEEFKLAEFTENERTLLALAAIYHDAAAEDVSKCHEERQSASSFRHDLTEHFPIDLVETISKALEQKEDDVHRVDESGVSERLRTYLRVLRFGDRMDFVRCSTVGPIFPDWRPQPSSAERFDTNLLDLPPKARLDFSGRANAKTPFQSALEACMHGAVDLASVTGGVRKDARNTGPYNRRFRLTPDQDLLQRAFDQSSHPITRMERMLDDNVRRMIAECAGIKTCHPERHRNCKADLRTGVYYGIHNSWHDLQQVRVPEGMSRVEKMQCAHDLSLLSPSTLREISREITRLKKEGIVMSLGTLDQQTLRSKAAQQTLQKRGLEVVSEQRQRAYKPDGTPLYKTVLVPKKKTV